MAAPSGSYAAHPGPTHHALAAHFSSSTAAAAGCGGTTASSVSPYPPFTSWPHLSVGGSIHPCDFSSSSATAAAAVASHVSQAPTGGPSTVPADDVDDQLRRLASFRYAAHVQGGKLEIRPVETRDDVDGAVQLLVTSFSDAWWRPASPRKSRLLKFWVQQYVERKRRQRPHAATLVGYYFYLPDGGESAAAKPPQLACTAEVWFDGMGGSGDPPEPAPPRGAPYICNMTVDERLRRRHIGWHLLKACEQLITEMCGSDEVYLHCRVRNKAPLDMYKKAGYKIVDTDGFCVWARFSHRKHLMRKKLGSGRTEITQFQAKKP